MIAPSLTRTQPTGGFGRHPGRASSPCAMASPIKHAKVWGTSVIGVRRLRLRCEAQSCSTRASHCATIFSFARLADAPSVLVSQDLLDGPLEKLARRGRDPKPEGVVVGENQFATHFKSRPTCELRTEFAISILAGPNTGHHTGSEIAGRARLTPSGSLRLWPAQTHSLTTK